MAEILEEFRDLPLDEFVNVGDVVTCLSEIHYGDDKAGRDLRLNLTGLLTWAIGKRSEPLETWIKSKEAKLLSLDEVKYESEEVVWLELRDAFVRAASFTRMPAGMIEFETMGHDEVETVLDSNYGIYWRCWDKPPTWKQRTETPWRNR